MGIGKIDREYGVREGWVRDEDDEIYMDGYNAFIFITTRDGTSGFQVKNDTGAVAFSSKSDGDGYVAKKLGVGTYNPQTTLDVAGRTKTDYFKMPTGATDGYVLGTDSYGEGTWQLISELFDESDPKGKSFNISLCRPGNSGDKWMYHESSASATDEVPVHFGYDVSLIGIVFINKVANKSIDLEFYINGTDIGDLVYTEEIRDAKRHAHTEGEAIIDISVGDRLSVFMGKVAPSTDPIDAVVELLFVTRTHNITEFSSND